MSTMKKKTRFLAVSGEYDRTFSAYSDACAWLDKISPATAAAGFDSIDATTTNDEDGIRTIEVRHVER